MSFIVLSQPLWPTVTDPHPTMLEMLPHLKRIHNSRPPADKFQVENFPLFKFKFQGYVWKCNKRLIVAMIDNLYLLVFIIDKFSSISFPIVSLSMVLLWTWSRSHKDREQNGWSKTLLFFFLGCFSQWRTSNKFWQY